MKRFIKCIMLSLICGMLFCAVASVASCNKIRQEITPPDSVFQKQVDAYLPIAMQKLYEFSDPVDVMLYKQERLRQLEADSIITSLSDQTLSNICAVLSKQQKTYGVSDIVYEYKANKRIYSALPEEPLPTPTPPAGKDSTDSIIPHSVQL